MTLGEVEEVVTWSSLRFHRIQSGKAYQIDGNDMHKNIVQHRKGETEKQQEIDEIKKY